MQKHAFGLRLPQLGPMENADLVGTDLTYNIHDFILKDLEDSHAPLPLLTRLREEGKLGYKTGEGFQTRRNPDGFQGKTVQLGGIFRQKGGRQDFSERL